MMVIGAALGLAVTSGVIWWRRVNCTSCRPRCPNSHGHEISGNQGLFFGSSVLLLAAVLERLS